MFQKFFLPQKGHYSGGLYDIISAGNCADMILAAFMNQRSI